MRAEYVQHLPESVEGGAMIVSVDPESAAGKAGIKEARYDYRNQRNSREKLH